MSKVTDIGTIDDKMVVVMLISVLLTESETLFKMKSSNNKNLLS